MNKQDLRRYVRMMKDTCTASQLAEMSAAAMRQLFAHPRVKDARTILAYYSLDDEVDTHALIDTLVAQGKTLLLPAVVSETELELRRYAGVADLRLGLFNIMEPVGEVFTDYDAIDTVVVPGVAFDSRNHRLGRGRGYYDRLLPRLGRAYRLAVCFPFQMLPGVPADDHDCSVDEVITARIARDGSVLP